MIHSKYYAYRGLYLSTGCRIEQNEDFCFNEKTVIVLPDDDSKSDETTFYTQTKGNVDDEEPFKGGTIKEKTVQNSFDGEGLISPEYAKKVSEQLKNYNFRKDSHSFQIRMPFTKGMLHEVDFQKFFNAQLQEGGIETPEKLLIIDIFGIERKLREAHIILTKSMFKCAGWLRELWKENPEQFPEEYRADPMKFFFNQMEKFEHTLYITGSDARLSNNSTTTMDYQFLSTLKLDFESFNKLATNQLEKVRQNSVENFRK